MSRNHFSCKAHSHSNLFLSLYADSQIRNEIQKSMSYRQLMNRHLLIGCYPSFEYHNLVYNKVWVSHNICSVLVMANEYFPSILHIMDCYKMNFIRVDKVNSKNWINIFFDWVHSTNLNYSLPDLLFLLNLFHQYKDLLSNHHNMESFLYNHKLSDIIYYLLMKCAFRLLLHILKTLKGYTQIQVKVQTIWYF